MFKLFLRLFATTLGSIICTLIFVHFFSSSILGPPPLAAYASQAQLLRLLSAQMEASDAAQVDLLVKQVFGEQVPYRISPYDQVQLPQPGKDPLLSEHHLVSFPNCFETTVYLPLKGHQEVLVIGPMETLGGPPGDKLPFIFSTIILVVGLIALLVSRPIWRNLSQFEQASIRLSEGDMAARAEVRFGGPISAMALRFNQMADALQQTFESQKHLLQAVSHELRTPVARIFFEIEMLELQPDEDKRKQRIQAINAHLEELNELLEELLLWVRLDPEAPVEEFQDQDLDAVLEKLLTEHRAHANGKQILCTNQLGPGTCVPAQERLFRRALGNLIQNGLRYASHQVEVHCSLENGYLMIAINDDGPGIEQADQHKVFEPFSRLDQSRDRKSGGVGLGLAITKRILERHGGWINLRRSNSGGACFETYWPLEPLPRA